MTGAHWSEEEGQAVWQDYEKYKQGPAEFRQLRGGGQKEVTKNINHYATTHAEKWKREGEEASKAADRVGRRLRQEAKKQVDAKAERARTAAMFEVDPESPEKQAAADIAAQTGRANTGGRGIIGSEPTDAIPESSQSSKDVPPPQGFGQSDVEVLVDAWVRHGSSKKAVDEVTAASGAQRALVDQGMKYVKGITGLPPSVNDSPGDAPPVGDTQFQWPPTREQWVLMTQRVLLVEDWVRNATAGGQQHAGAADRLKKDIMAAVQPRLDDVLRQALAARKSTAAADPLATGAAAQQQAMDDMRKSMSALTAKVAAAEQAARDAMAKTRAGAVESTAPGTGDLIRNLNQGLGDLKRDLQGLRAEHRKELAELAKNFHEAVPKVLHRSDTNAADKIAAAQRPLAELLEELSRKNEEVERSVEFLEARQTQSASDVSMAEVQGELRERSVAEVELRGEVARLREQMGRAMERTDPSATDVEALRAELAGIREDAASTTGRLDEMTRRAGDGTARQHATGSGTDGDIGAMRARAARAEQELADMKKEMAEFRERMDAQMTKSARDEEELKGELTRMHDKTQRQLLEAQTQMQVMSDSVDRLDARPERVVIAAAPGPPAETSLGERIAKSKGKKKFQRSVTVASSDPGKPPVTRPEPLSQYFSTLAPALLAQAHRSLHRNGEAMFDDAADFRHFQATAQTTYPPDDVVAGMDGNVVKAFFDLVVRDFEKVRQGLAESTAVRCLNCKKTEEESPREFINRFTSVAAGATFDERKTALERKDVAGAHLWSAIIERQPATDFELTKAIETAEAKWQEERAAGDGFGVNGLDRGANGPADSKNAGGASPSGFAGMPGYGGANQGQQSWMGQGQMGANGHAPPGINGLGHFGQQPQQFGHGQQRPRGSSGFGQGQQRPHQDYRAEALDPNDPRDEYELRSAKQAAWAQTRKYKDAHVAQQLPAERRQDVLCAYMANGLRCLFPAACCFPVHEKRSGLKKVTLHPRTAELGYEDVTDF